MRRHGVGRMQVRGCGVGRMDMGFERMGVQKLVGFQHRKPWVFPDGHVEAGRIPLIRKVSYVGRMGVRVRSWVWPRPLQALPRIASG